MVSLSYIYTLILLKFWRKFIVSQITKLLKSLCLILLRSYTIPLTHELYFIRNLFCSINMSLSDLQMYIPNAVKCFEYDEFIHCCNFNVYFYTKLECTLQKHDNIDSKHEAVTRTFWLTFSIWRLNIQNLHIDSVMKCVHIYTREYKKY